MSRLHTRTLGTTGRRVALLHGLLGQGRNWTQVAKALVADPGVRATLIDLPDHGRSPWTSGFSYLAMADAVAAELAALAPGERWVLVGHSMGAKAAMLLALRRPELLDGLAVVDMAPQAYSSAERDFTAIFAGVAGLDLASLRTREEADAALAAAIPAPGVRAFVLQNLRRDGAGWAWQANLAMLAAHLPQLGGWPAEAVAGRRYDEPVLWLTGADSAYVTEASQEPMRALFPAARQVRVRGAGHWVHTDAPEVTVAALRRYLAGLG